MFYQRTILITCSALFITACGGVDDNVPQNFTQCLPNTWSHEFVIDNTTSAAKTSTRWCCKLTSFVKMAPRA